jgi:hypothetical protein
MYVCCCPPIPPTDYELQDGARAPLGGAQYKVKYHSWLGACIKYGCARSESVVADGASVDLGTAPLQARRDLVAAVAFQIISAASSASSKVTV